ncbi:uncharacterized protein LOC121383865 [Gigantopelta aegis]|uniref:uncharacterized protein LOC121383865 n=1 Tax=Gigantopelta aegis TaxID=1735272 RepID=UPI001B888603|nr:uncharacterized protein LOC121383865 [Gigantopelta aegis]
MDINQSQSFDGTLKRVHTEVSDSSSSDEESKSLNVKKSKVISLKTWPRFLVIGSSDEGALKKLSPFAIQKGLEGLAGEPKTVKKLRNGSLLVECSTESHSRNLLKSKMICNISIIVSPHATLNSSKGVVRSRDLEGVSEDEICENLSSQGVTSVKRIKVRRNNELVPTNTLILSFNVPTLPSSVKAGYLNIPVVPYIPNPLRCFKCQKFGHGQNTCRNRLTCARCGQFDHDSKTCQNDMICTNCKGKHFAYSRECPKWKVEKQVQQVKVEKRLTFIDARKLVESSTNVVLGKSYATAVKVSTTSIATQTDLTWPNSEDTFKKISHPKDVKKQTVHKQVSTSTQVSLDSRNPSRGSSLGEPGPSKPPSRKDTKKQHKDSSSGRLKKAEKKLVSTNNPFEALADVDDQMDIVPDDRRHPQRSHKPKITSVLPPND